MKGEGSTMECVRDKDREIKGERSKEGYYASVRMRSEAYGSHFVCVCVCVCVCSERICFFRRLCAKVSVSTDSIPCFLSLQFADLQNKASFLRYGKICLPRGFCDRIRLLQIKICS